MPNKRHVPRTEGTRVMAQTLCLAAEKFLGSDFIFMAAVIKVLVVSGNLTQVQSPTDLLTRSTLVLFPAYYLPKTG